MAVREAWNDEVAERFDYDQGIELLPSEPFEAQGLSMDWVKRYWRAHWVLPSVTAGDQMLHRLRPGTTDNPFTNDDLRTLLRTADISPFFIERMIEISFATYTRVDLRRMFKAGVLTEDEVYQGYLDIGYDEAKARNLSDFAILDARENERDLAADLGAIRTERLGRTRFLRRAISHLMIRPCTWSAGRLYAPSSVYTPPSSNSPSM